MYDRKDVQSVLLLGGTSEIGLQLIRLLATENTQLRVILAGRNTEAMEEAALALRTAPEAETRIVALEFSRDKDVGAAVWDLSKIRPVDLIIVAVGSNPQPATDTTNIVYTNLLGPADFIERYCLAFQGHRVRILNLSTFAVTRPRGSNFQYGASKAGLEFFIDGLCERFPSVTATSVRLSKVDSRMSERFAKTPLDLTVLEAAAGLKRFVSRGPRRAWVPRTLRPIARLVRAMPARILRNLDQRFSPNAT